MSLYVNRDEHLDFFNLIFNINIMMMLTIFIEHFINMFSDDFKFIRGDFLSSLYFD